MPELRTRESTSHQHGTTSRGGRVSWWSGAAIVCWALLAIAVPVDALEFESSLETKIREACWIVVVDVTDAPQWEGDALKFKIRSSVLGEGDATRLTLTSKRTAFSAPGGGRVPASERAGDRYVYFLRDFKDGSYQTLGRRRVRDDTIEEGGVSYPLPTYEAGLRGVRTAVVARDSEVVDAWLAGISGQNPLTSAILLDEIRLEHWRGPNAIPSLSGLSEEQLGRISKTCVELLGREDQRLRVDVLRTMVVVHKFAPESSRGELRAKAREYLASDERSLRLASLGLLAHLGDRIAFDSAVEVLRASEDELELAEAIRALGTLARTDKSYRQQKVVVRLLASRLSQERLEAALIHALPYFTDERHRSVEEWRTWWAESREDYPPE